jgi:hypothetical protein
MLQPNNIPAAEIRMWIMLTMDCSLSAVYSVNWKSRNRAVNAPDDNNTETQRDSQTHALRETIETYVIQPTATPVGEPITHVDNRRRRRKPPAEHTVRKRTGRESHFSVNLRSDTTLFTIDGSHRSTDRIYSLSET